MPSGEPHYAATSDRGDEATDAVDARPYDPSDEEQRPATRQAARVDDPNPTAGELLDESRAAVHAAYSRVARALAVRDADCLLAEMAHDASYSRALVRINGRRRVIAYMLERCVASDGVEVPGTRIKLVGNVAIARKQTGTVSAGRDFTFVRRGRRWRLIAIRDWTTEALAPPVDVVADPKLFRRLPPETGDENVELRKVEGGRPLIVP